MKSKQLHKHTLPIVMVAAALLALSVVGFQAYSGTDRGQVLHQALLSRVLKVKIGSNGLAHISLNRDDVVAQPVPAAAASAKLPAVNLLGESTQFNATLQAAVASASTSTGQ